MKSNRRRMEKKLDADERRKLLATGIETANGIRASITEQGLVQDARMLGDVRPVPGEHSVSVGTTLDNPNYPLFLNNGFVHYLSGEMVGPFNFMEKGQAATEERVRGIWRRPIK